MPINIMDGMHAVEELDKCLQIIGKYAGRLKADPDKAAGDLAEALEEIEKSCKALDDGVKKYLALGFKANALDDGSDVLLDISGGALLIGVQKGLGSCHRMANVYHNSIDRWFDRVFRSDRQAYGELAGIFARLGSADGDMFDLMVNSARQVQQSADQTLKLIGEDKKQEARAQVLSSAAELNDLRVRINELLARLYGLRAEFIAAAHV